MAVQSFGIASTPISAGPISGGNIVYGAYTLTASAGSYALTGQSVIITYVGTGRTLGDGWEILAKSGDIINWEAGKRHEFVALEPNSRCVNIPKTFFGTKKGE